MAAATVDEVYELIRSVSFPNAKAKHLVEMSCQLVERFNGEVPESAADLTSLAGVGRKTANVIRAVWFGKATMAVDTHVYRVSHRMGLVPATADSPRKVEDYLMANIPESDIPNAHHWLLLHGRYICKSAKPLCEQCFFNEHCPKRLKTVNYSNTYKMNVKKINHFCRMWLLTTTVSGSRNTRKSIWQPSLISRKASGRPLRTMPVSMTK